MVTCREKVCVEISPDGNPYEPVLRRLCAESSETYGLHTFKIHMVREQRRGKVLANTLLFQDMCVCLYM